MKCRRTAGLRLRPPASAPGSGAPCRPRTRSPATRAPPPAPPGARSAAHSRGQLTCRAGRGANGASSGEGRPWAPDLGAGCRSGCGAEALGGGRPAGARDDRACAQPGAPRPRPERGPREPADAPQRPPPLPGAEHCARLCPPRSRWGGGRAPSRGWAPRGPERCAAAGPGHPGRPRTALGLGGQLGELKNTGARPYPKPAKPVSGGGPPAPAVCKSSPGDFFVQRPVIHFLKGLNLVPITELLERPKSIRDFTHFLK